jgi:hypothetical protein
MPKRNPNRRRKSSRKPHIHDTLSGTHYPDASFSPQGCSQLYDGYGDIPGFSEDSIQRQLGYMIPVPLSPASQVYNEDIRQTGDAQYGMHGDGDEGATRGWWYMYSHPGMCGDVGVWVHGYAYVDVDHSYQSNRDGDGGGYNNHNDYPQMGRLSSPPLCTYREGYHDPILKDQTEDWWRLFGHDIPVQFILQSAKGPEPATGHSGEEGMSNVGLQYRYDESTDGKRKDEWNVAAYFAPYRTPEMEACSTVKRASVGVYGYGNGKNGEEGSENDVQSTVTGEPIDGFDLRYRGRDDWDCDFCGLECFCWTVEASGTEV